MGKNILDILNEYSNIMLAVEEADGELTEDLSAELKITEDEIENKLRNYKQFFETLKFRIEQNKNTTKKLQAKNNTLTNTISKLQEYVKLAVSTFGEVNKSGNKIYKAEDYSVYLKKTTVLELDTLEDKEITGDTFHNENYVYETIQIQLPNDEKTKFAILKAITDIDNTLEFETTKVLNKSLLKTHTVSGVYNCDNKICDAYTTHLLKDCSCTKQFKLIDNISPIFK